MGVAGAYGVAPRRRQQRPVAAVGARHLARDGEASRTLEVEAELEKVVTESARKDRPALEWSAAGVRGGALIVRGGEATLPLRQNADFSDGTIEFWVKPGDWDNLTEPTSRHSPFRYRNVTLNLLTLYGVPRRGKGEPVVLVSARISRTMGFGGAGKSLRSAKASVRLATTQRSDRRRSPARQSSSNRVDRRTTTGQPPTVTAIAGRRT